MKIYYVYILLCSDNSFYIGVTNNLELRVAQHEVGLHSSSYTYPRRPVRLVYFESFDNINTAILREKQLKGWSRKKKLALINGDFNALSRLAHGSV